MNTEILALIFNDFYLLVLLHFEKSAIDWANDDGCEKFLYAS